MNPYFRHILVFILYIPMWIVNFFVAPLIFLLGQTRKTIERTIEGKINVFSWFINIDEPSMKENMYGDNEYLKRHSIEDIEERNFFVRLFWFWIWNVVRNSFWYFKMHVITPIPKIINKENIKVLKNTSGKDNLHWCSWDDRGIIHVEYTIDGVKYFRYSQTKEIRFLLFWKRIQKIQFGASGIEDKNRYIYKINWRNGR